MPQTWASQSWLPSAFSHLVHEVMPEASASAGVISFFSFLFLFFSFLSFLYSPPLFPLSSPSFSFIGV